MDEFLVRVTGIEPARRKALDPKSSASASSATLALYFYGRISRPRYIILKSSAPVKVYIEPG